MPKIAKAPKPKAVKKAKQPEPERQVAGIMPGQAAYASYLGIGPLTPYITGVDRSRRKVKAGEKTPFAKVSIMIHDHWAEDMIKDMLSMAGNPNISGKRWRYELHRIELK